MYATGKPARSTSLADTPSYAPGTMRPCFRLMSWRSRWRRFMVTRQGITLEDRRVGVTGRTSARRDRDSNAGLAGEAIPGGGPVSAPAHSRAWAVAGTPVLGACRGNALGEGEGPRRGVEARPIGYA